MATVADLTDALEEFHAATGHARQPAFREVVARIREVVREGSTEKAAVALRRAITPWLDYTSFQTLYRLYKSLPAPPSETVSKIAVLGGMSTSKLAQAIELAYFAMGGRAEGFETEYGTYRQDILDPSSSLYQRQPTTIFLATCWRDMVHRPTLQSDAADVARLIDAEVAHWLNLWRSAHQRLGCQIIQNNFDRPAWRQLNNHDARHAGGFGRYVNLLNQALADSAPPYVIIHDLDDLSAAVGRAAWGDERLYHHAKMPCPPQSLVNYGFSVASLLAAQSGLTKKCLVLDLDNTLWGGVIGDDGIGGIRLGQGDGEGEAFLAFQRYAKSLKERGILLAVCSKNTEAIAKSVFEDHPEMDLRLDDISCFVANWDDKASNLREIALRLNIGLNSLVFADDNPMERALVRQLAPVVAVPELPSDPADYIQAIEQHRYFQITSLGREDLQRAEYYRANGEREVLLTSGENIDDFLASLGMVATVAPIDGVSLERSAQLINKSNQFNLTTRRRTTAEVSALLADPRWFTCTVSLRDRFGDNGLISVLLARRDDDTMVIDTWLMSCRVLKRGVEALMHNYLCGWAMQHGLRRVRGEYRPTAKNGIVKDHYRDLGFSLVEESSDRAVWEQPLSDAWIPHAVRIELDDRFPSDDRATVLPFAHPAEAAEDTRPAKAA